MTKKKNKTKKKEETYCLTPKGIFECCMMDAFNEPFESRRTALAWELFEGRMRKGGYIQDPEPEKKK